MMRRIRLVLAAAALGLFPSCAEDPGGPEEFDVDPPADAIMVGETVQLSAIEAPGPVSWSSNNSIIAEVNPATGLVTGRSSGRATITAVVGGSYASATIDVSPDPSAQHPFSDIAGIFTTTYPGAFGNRACTGCHGVTYDWVRDRVTPGNPDAGILICKITSGAVGTCGGNPMPLPAPQIAAIRNWIEAGANQ
jgi:hypothetical protein